MASGSSDCSPNAPLASKAPSALDFSSPLTASADSADSTGANLRVRRSCAPDAGFQEPFPWSHAHRRVREAFDDAYSRSSFGVVSDENGILNVVR
jgi:hypothetical protein